MNTEHARRCVGIINKKRCDFYFEWKDCPQCSTTNDIVSRQCRQCEHELIDPNAKLTPFQQTIIEVEVMQSKYWIQESGKYTQLRAQYTYKMPSGLHQIAYESFSPTASEKAKNVFYGNFVKKHLTDSSFWYPHLQDPMYLKAMLNHIKSPTHLKIKWDGEKWIMSKKVFPVLDNFL